MNEVSANSAILTKGSSAGLAVAMHGGGGTIDLSAPGGGSVNLSGPAPQPRENTSVDAETPKIERIDWANVKELNVQEHIANTVQAADAVGMEVLNFVNLAAGHIQAQSDAAHESWTNTTARTSRALAAFHEGLSSTWSEPARADASQEAVTISADFEAVLLMVKMRFLGNWGSIMNRKFVSQQVQHAERREEWVFSCVVKVEEDLGALGPIVGEMPEFQEVWTVDHQARSVESTFKNVTAAWSVSVQATLRVTEGQAGQFRAGYTHPIHSPRPGPDHTSSHSSTI